MQLTLGQQVALSLRRRPLALPLLLATVCVDLLLYWRLLHSDTVDASVVYHFVMLGQTALLAIWTACCASWWWLRLLLSLAVIALFSLTPPGPTLSLESLDTYCVYFAAILGVQLIRNLIGLHRTGGVRSLRFQTRHLLIAMTLTGGLGAGLKLLTPDNFVIHSDDLVLLGSIFFAVVLTPWVCRWIVLGARRNFGNNALAVVYCLMATTAFGFVLGVITGGVFDELFIQALNGVAFVCAMWFIAVDVAPDARRRMAARRDRRQRHQPPQAVLPLPAEVVEAPAKAQQAAPQPLDLDA